MSCIESDTTLPAESVDETTGVNYHVNVSATSPIRVTFSAPSGGTIEGVRVEPSGPTVGSDYVEFGTAHVDTEYSVYVDYTEAPMEAVTPGPVCRPTKSPVFKPVTSCPS